ncbi:hypothetical protein [Bacillus sp. EAC]|uniref:hypothetical protein n=1 Tax=Bacillus sp. EAC TaxID=1978338 RepID=UPI000B4412BC|nr:hypothetical protein [Bacillus sp. EAC]
MFDPTAFDNMKVITEGIIYDKDLDGEFEIIDRNDLVNLSKMSREFSLQFKKINTNQINSICKITLSTTARDLYSELLKGDSNVGCTVEIAYFFPKELKIEVLKRSLLLLNSHTRQEFSVIRNIKQGIIDKNTIETSVIFYFTEKITEDDFDKLEELIHISEIMLQWYDEQLLKEI